ncbi:MAG: hypothetical protein IJL32_02055 [Oscillospiraceae bacterium]|nr:hypothetical protein [Oscillospiraceae bacterium]
MKKSVFAIISVFSIPCLLFGCTSASKFPASRVELSSPASQVSMPDLTSNSDVMIEYRTDAPETIAMITGKFSDIHVQNEQDAASVIASLANVLGIQDVSQEIMFVDRQDVSGSSLTAYTFRQYYENVPVLSDVLKVIVDQSGTPTMLMNGYHAIESFSVTPAVDRKAVKKLIKDEYQSRTDGDPELGISFAFRAGQPVLVWYADIKDSVVKSVYADAASGEILYAEGPVGD